MAARSHVRLFKKIAVLTTWVWMGSLGIGNTLFADEDLARTIMQARTPHQVFGLPESASPEEIKKQYRRLASKFSEGRYQGKYGNEVIKKVHIAEEAITKGKDHVWNQLYGGGAHAPTRGHSTSTSGRSASDRTVYTGDDWTTENSANCAARFGGLYHPALHGITLIGKDRVQLELVSKVPFTDTIWPKVKEFEESGTRHQALVFRAKVPNGTALGMKQSHRTLITVPYTGNLDQDVALANMMAQALGELPEEYAHLVFDMFAHPYYHGKRDIFLNRWVEHPEALGKATDHGIHLFPPAFTKGINQKDVNVVVRHEFGHILGQRKLFDEFGADFRGYEAAIARDGNHVSAYSASAQGSFDELGEDVAEAVRAYLETDAGRLRPDVRSRYGARFNYIDQWFLKDPKAKQFAAFALASAMVTAGAFTPSDQAFATERAAFVPAGNGKHLVYLNPYAPADAKKDAGSAR